MWGGSFGSSRNSGAGAPGRKIPATIFRLLSSSATYVVPFSLTGLLSPVALFRAGTIHDHAIGQAGPSILSSSSKGPRRPPRNLPPGFACGGKAAARTACRTDRASSAGSAGAIRLVDKTAEGDRWGGRGGAGLPPPDLD